MSNQANKSLLFTLTNGLYKGDVCDLCATNLTKQIFYIFFCLIRFDIFSKRLFASVLNKWWLRCCWPPWWHQLSEESRSFEVWMKDRGDDCKMWKDCHCRALLVYYCVFCVIYFTDRERECACLCVYVRARRQRSTGLSAHHSLSAGLLRWHDCHNCSGG